MTPIKVGFLGGGNPHALAIARHFTEVLCVSVQ